MKYTLDTVNKTIQLLEECNLNSLFLLLKDVFEDKNDKLEEWKLIPKETIKIEKEYVEKQLTNPYNPYISPYNPTVQPQIWYNTHQNTDNTENLKIN